MSLIHVPNNNTTFLHLLESFLVQVLDVQRFASFTQNLLLLLSLCLPLTTPLFCLRINVMKNISGHRPSHFKYLYFNLWEKPTLNPPRAHQLLHVASKMEAGEGFLLLSVILRSPLGLLFFLTSSLILKKTMTRSEMAGGGTFSRCGEYK